MKAHLWIWVVFERLAHLLAVFCLDKTVDNEVLERRLVKQRC